MRSMTGFGRGRAGEVTVEIRAVNHRHLDVKLRPTLAAELEREVLAAVRGAIERGAIQVTIDSGVDGTGEAHTINAAAAARAHVELSELAHALRLPAPALTDVLAVPGVLVSGGRRAEVVPTLAPDELRRALADALIALEQMRAREGEALAADLRGRLASIQAHVAAMQELAGDVPGRLREALIARVRKAGGPEIDGARLAQEAALLADRTDVTEELVRLTVHASEFATLIGVPGVVGRRLDFLIQELARELGTIGAKAPSVEIVTRVVAAKAELEKAREQAQNVE